MLRDNRNATAQAVSERQARVARSKSGIARRRRCCRESNSWSARCKRGYIASAQIESAASEKSQRELENLAIAEKLRDLDAERNACETRASLLQFESEQVRARVGEIDALLRETRHALDGSRDRKAEVSTAAVKLQSDAEHHAQTCINDLGRTAELMATPLCRGSPVTNLPPRNSHARRCARGSMLWAGEHDGARGIQRDRGAAGFLDTQRKDLLESIENTQATIKEIDIFSRQKFEEAFNKINENFQVTFKKLFGGGQGL